MLLFIETLMLTNVITNYIQTQDYLTPPTQILATITALLLAIIYTKTLTLGAWGKWEQYIIIPIPIVAGLLTSIIPINLGLALLLGLILLLILIYFVYRSTYFKSLLIKPKPILILKAATTGVFLSVALTAATISMLHPIPTNNLQIGEKVGKATSQQIEKLAQKDPTLSQLSQLGILNNLDIGQDITNQVEGFIEPYKKFLSPLMATVAFAMIQGLGVLAYVVFAITVTPLFWLAKKTRFIKMETATVDRETLTF